MQTFLTIDDAKRELNLEEWEVNRAICRGVLSAQRAGGGEWRITQEQITIALRSDDLDGPDLKRDWFDSRAESHRSQIFVSAVAAALKAGIPEVDPGADQSAAYAGAIRVAGQATPKPLMIAVYNGKDLPYRNQAELYAVLQVRRLAQQESRRVVVKVGSGLPTGPLANLYRNPAEYQRLTQQAWDRFLTNDIPVRHSYQTDVPGRPVERRFSLPHSAITGLDWNRIRRLAF